MRLEEASKTPLSPVTDSQLADAETVPASVLASLPDVVTLPPAPARSRPTTAAARPQALASGMGDSADKTPDSLERSSRCLKEPPANSRSDADAS